MGNTALILEWMSGPREKEAWRSSGETGDRSPHPVLPQSRWRLVPSHWYTDGGKEGAWHRPVQPSEISAQGTNPELLRKAWQAGQVLKPSVRSHTAQGTSLVITASPAPPPFFFYKAFKMKRWKT